MIRYAEFCTGIGGFSLGIQASSLTAECVYSNEIDDKCANTYELNFKRQFDSADIFGINEDEIPDFEMLCAGFPCQPFSQAGKTLGFEDERGKVFYKLMDIIRNKKPKIVFLENVPNMLRHDKGKTFSFMKKSIEEAGYKVFYKILDSAYFGVPQSRPRVYIVALQKERFIDVEFPFTEKRTVKTSLRGYLKNDDFSIPISDKWQEYIDYYTGKINEEDLSFALPKTRKKLERIAKGCNLEDCVFQIRSSGIRAYSLDEPYPTFAVSNSGGGAMIPVLTKERRHMNVTEIINLMGFPKEFKFNVSRTDAIKQLANAVCPPVITSICNDIATIL